MLIHLFTSLFTWCLLDFDKVKTILDLVQKIKSTKKYRKNNKKIVFKRLQ